MAKPISTFKIREIMTPSPIAVIFKDKLFDIMELFISKQISGAAVIEPATGKVLTVVSEADLMKFAAVSPLTEPLITFKPKLPAREDLITVYPDDSFAEVYKRFLTHPIKRVIVVDLEMHLLGIVSRRDVLKAFLKSQTP